MRERLGNKECMSKRHQKLKRHRYYESRPDFNPPCWCGVKNPHFHSVHGGCGGMGIIDCHCGGDLCVCHNHGEVECFGCDDCDREDDCGDGEDY